MHGSEYNEACMRKGLPKVACWRYETDGIKLKVFFVAGETDIIDHGKANGQRCFGCTEDQNEWDSESVVAMEDLE